MLFTKKIFYSMAMALVLGFSEAAAVPETPGFGKRGDGFISLDFSVTRDPAKIFNSTAGGTVKRGDYPETLVNKNTYYITDVIVGSNQEKISVDIDTGSSDLWVIDSSSGLDATYGSYDSSSSSTYQYVQSGFSIAYVDQSYANGNWVKDTVVLGSSSGPSLKAQEFGDATDTTIKYGIFGIGLTNLESITQGGGSSYSNVPQSLKDQGYISKVAYSLYLASEDAASGTLLFGGIDNAKYSGSLVSLPVTSEDRLNVDVKSISGDGKTTSVATSITLDSGSTISYLPQDVLSSFAGNVGLHYSQAGYYYWDSVSDAVDITINFDGISITIPASDVVGPLTDTNGDVLTESALLILPATQYYTLGDNFLRHAYIVFNLDDKTISLAPVKYTSSSSITAITS